MSEEFSPVLLNNWCLRFDEKRVNACKKKCKLCSFERRNHSDLRGEPEANFMGPLVRHPTDEVSCESSKKIHMFHYRCIDSFVMNNKGIYRNDKLNNGQGCPGCLKCYDAPDAIQYLRENPFKSKKKKKVTKKKTNDDDDELEIENEGVMQVGGKKRNREKIEYLCYVHIIQASGLKLKDSDKAVAPVCVMSGFGQNLKTPSANLERTYTYVWDQTFSFKKKMDEEEFRNEEISIRIENHSKLWKNDLIGFVKFQPAAVREQKNNEFYKTWTNIVQMGKGGGLGAHGQLQVSICVFSEKDRQDNPKLPIHVYDLETEMWDTANDGFTEEAHDEDYLQKAIEAQKSSSGALSNSLGQWKCVKIRVYKGEDLPKLNNKGWCDSYCTLTYKGLGFVGKKALKSCIKKNSRSPEWNWEFTIPLQANTPIFDNRLELRVMSEGSFITGAKQIGMMLFNLTDILEHNENHDAFWRDIYEDEDGKAPTYRGRILIDYDIQEDIEDLSLIKYSDTAPFLKSEKEPVLGSYKLDLEIYEGSLLLGDHSEYQVDIAWGHSMLGDSKIENRSIGGKVWETIYGKKSSKNKNIVEFLQKKSLIVHNFPIPQKDIDGDITDDTNNNTSEHKGLQQHKGMGDHGKEVPFTTNSVTSQYQMQMPDILIYVSKKNKPDECVGYLRIPVSNVKRPTENWEHGEDLTIFPSLWNNKECSARCLALKPLIELHAKTYGFLTIKTCITRLTRNEANNNNKESSWLSLPPVERQNYRLVASIYQAKELASIDSSGLSNPFVTVQLGDLDLKTKHVSKSCYPLWFEALEAKNVTLPKNLHFAPDIVITVRHHTGNSVIVWRDPSVFMGNTYINCHDHASKGNSEPRWYPLEFEEHRYGNICCEFSLLPESPSLRSVDRQAPQSLIQQWPSYCVEVRALAIRGLLGSQLRSRSKNPLYEIECWGNIMTIDLEKANKKKTVIIIKKPTNPVFYSSLNVRVWEENKKGGNGELKAVTSIPVDKLVTSGINWYKLIDLCSRNPNTLAKTVLKKWKHRLDAPKKGETFTDGIKYTYKPPPVIMNDDDDINEFNNDDDNDDDVKGDQMGDMVMNNNTNNKLRTNELSESLLSDDFVSDNVVMDIINEEEAVADRKAMQPRNVDMAGNEVFEEKVIQSMDIPDLDVNVYPVDEKEDLWNKTWMVSCEYEMLPFVKLPFQEFSLKTGKDEVHQTFLEKLFVPSKKDVGMIRGSFHCYPYKKSNDNDRKENHKSDFDNQNYKTQKEYLVRCYITKCIQLVAGSATKCDPYVTVTLGEQLPYKTEVVDRDINPKFYEKAEFQRVKFPNTDTVLKVEVWNDNGRFVKPIGSTDIYLENRLFSKSWNKEFNKTKGLKYQRPVEKRALFLEGSKIPMGFIELCIDIVPQANKSLEPLKYILDPPKRIEWMVRCIAYDTRDVTSKNVYQNDEDCCLWQVCAPPNQSDVQLRMGFPKSIVHKTDTHSRCIDGEAMFNWRTSHLIELPAPKPLAHFKISVWNINWSPDDCIAEAVIPLWTWLEYARRDHRSKISQLDTLKGDDLLDLQKSCIHHLPKQELHLTHPFNSDEGYVNIEMELLPAEFAKLAPFRAGDGPEGWKIDKKVNAPEYTLTKHKRPDSSFKWYEIHKQIWWRLKYCFKKIWVYLLLFFIVAVACVIYLVELHGGVV